VIRVSGDGLGDERLDDVKDVPGVGGGLNDDGVGGLEVLGGPVGELGEGDASGTEDDLLAGVDGPGDEIELVNDE